MRASARSVTLAVIFFAAVMPAARAETSAITDAFVRDTSHAFALLQQSDDVAQTNGRGSNLRAFAREDSKSQRIANEALVAWAQAEQRAAKAASQTRSLDGLGPLFYPFDAVVLPLDIHGPARTKADQAILTQLRALQDQAFDGLYASTQVTVLTRLEHDYVDYIKNGDDPELRRLSVQNLPRVRRLLAELRRF